jgi:hypothetical protein
MPGGVVKVLVGVAVAAGIVWMAAPWVAMARRGTLDEQACADMRAPVLPRPRCAPGARGTTSIGVEPAPRSVEHS